MLTEHYDRNPEKQLLKRRVGYIHSWQLDERETSVFEGNARYLRYPPKVVLVKFYEMKKEGKNFLIDQQRSSSNLDNLKAKLIIKSQF